MYTVEWWNALFITMNEILWGWPLVIAVMVVGGVLTLSLGGVQFRYFIKACRMLFEPAEKSEASEDSISPLQAFLNALSSSLGNGGLAGMATAINAGGPGAAFWVFILGFFAMAIRFAEVFVSTAYVEQQKGGRLRGGPFVYLKQLPGGKYIVPVYAFLALMLCLIGGNAMQCNSMTLSVQRIADVPSIGFAIFFFVLLTYMMFGGARRIMKMSEAVIPVKVVLFFSAIIISLVYHAPSLYDALRTIVIGAFNPQALGAGILGYTVQESIRFAFSRGLNASEAGLGNAGILYGATKSDSPVKTALTSMITTFISLHLVCFSLMVVIVASGAWKTGLTSTPLVAAALETVFGSYGAWIVAFLSFTFGLGVLIAYAYTGRECWLYLTGGRFQEVYAILFTAVASFGAVSSVQLIWSMIDTVNAFVLAINFVAFLWLIPVMRKHLRDFSLTQKLKGKPKLDTIVGNQR